MPQRSEFLRLPETVCPFCDGKLNATTSVSEHDVGPSAGDITVCIHCSQEIVFGDDLSLRRPAAGELEARFRRNPGFEVAIRELQRRVRAADRGSQPEELPGSEEAADMEDADKAAIEVACEIHPLLAGLHSRIQGAVLADLLAAWLAGHHGANAADTMAFREELLALHTEAVRRLVAMDRDALTQPDDSPARGPGPRCGNP